MTPEPTGPDAAGRDATGADCGSSWQADAEAYDAWFDGPWGRHASTVERHAVLGAAGDLRGRAVADVGCGTGRLLPELAARVGRDGHVVGVEPDPAMVAVAARRTGVPLVVGDGHHLPLRTASVDVALAVTVCEFTTDPALVVAELARITRPGGRVVVGALDRRSPWGLANRDQFDRPPWSGARFLDPAALEGLGRPHGRTRITHALYAPRALPLLGWWGPPLEHVGHRLGLPFAAFHVLTVERGVD